MSFENIFLIVCFIICLINFILNFFIGLFLVRSHQDILIKLNQIELDPYELPQKEEGKKQKTWDQKYEDELSSITERNSQDRGLTDV